MTTHLETLSHPIVVLVRGLPGSGKSHFAHALAAAVGPQAVELDPDTIDYSSPAYARHLQTATAEGVDPALFPYRFLRGQAYDGIRDHKVVIWNQPFTNLDIFNKMVGRFRDTAAEHHTTVSILVVEVGVDPATAESRVAERKAAGGHGPSAEKFQQFVTDYTSFAKEGYDVVAVNGTDDTAQSVGTVLTRIKTLAA